MHRPVEQQGQTGVNTHLVRAGGSMTRREETALVRLWQQWSKNKPYTNHTVVSFFFDAAQKHPKFEQYNAFEVFDSVTNAMPDSAT